MKKLTAIGLLWACALSAPHASGGQRLAMRVSPAVSMAPASLTVRMTIEPSDDNRKLSVVVDSPGFRRESEIPLDGKRSQRVIVFELREVPTGLYEVRATLGGSTGELARAMQLVKVQPAPGYDR